MSLSLLEAQQNLKVKLNYDYNSNFEIYTCILASNLLDEKSNNKSS